MSQSLYKAQHLCTPVRCRGREGNTGKEADSKDTASYWRPWDCSKMMQVTHDDGKSCRRTMMRARVAIISRGVRWADGFHQGPGHLYKDSVPGLKEVDRFQHDPGNIWISCTTHIFFQSWLWLGEEDMLSVVDPPLNYQLLFTFLSQNHCLEKRLKELFCVI